MPVRSASQRSQAGQRRGKLDIDSSSFFRLLRLVNLTAKPFFTQFADRHDLTINEWRVMIVLANRSGIAAHEVCTLVGMDKMSVSRAVRRLEAHGRLSRCTDPTDRRRTLLRLTPEGLAVFDSIAPNAIQREQRLLGALTDSERMTFVDLIAKLEREAEGWVDEARPEPQNP